MTSTADRPHTAIEPGVAVTKAHTATGNQWRSRVESGDWDAITAQLDEYGGALLPKLLTADETVALRGCYDDDAYFRATIDMARYRFGQGEYK